MRLFGGILENRSLLFSLSGSKNQSCRNLHDQHSLSKIQIFIHPKADIYNSPSIDVYTQRSILLGILRSRFTLTLFGNAHRRSWRTHALFIRFYSTIFHPRSTVCVHLSERRPSSGKYVLSPSIRINLQIANGIAESHGTHR